MSTLQNEVHRETLREQWREAFLEYEEAKKMPLSPESLTKYALATVRLRKIAEAP